ncbi:SIR2 family protein [Anaerosporobacter faecicola]|uniref:SIR2 family protein n=1 Tax=Anaerosporobacter faecicola TaxID=2718714 RepID=UPI00143BC0D9|nr:SIR2 family protein [Anaerosporobacter faecicola]
MESMNNEESDKLSKFDELKEILLTSTPILFLGAGFSVGAENLISTMDGTGLKQYIFDSLVRDKIPKEDIEEVQGYDLRRLCDEVYSIYDGKDELKKLLLLCFKNTKPGEEKFHYKLTDYPWKKIYTVNIDDLVEYIYKKNDIDIEVQNKKELKISNCDVQLYKLHGCVNNPDDGFIFSESEYTDLITDALDAKLNSFSIEMQKNNIIFVGASMDEPDIKYYLKKYADAGCKYRDNKLFFIDYNPSRYVRKTVKELGGKLIQCSAAEFLKFVSGLHYDPSTYEKAKIELNYSGIYRLEDISKTYKTPYESKLYTGYFCEWQDVYDGWTFEETNYKLAKAKLDELINTNDNIKCFSIYGTISSGKSCLLRQLGYYLSSQGYEVLEYRGRYLNRKIIFDFIRKSPKKSFALLIDGGSYYYESIEKMFFSNIGDKELVILTSSREYYHNRKKYYLDGNNYVAYKQKDIFTKDDAISIEGTLESKSYLSYMASLSKEKRIAEIKKKSSMINLVVALTYGVAMKTSKHYWENCLKKLSFEENKLLIELALFDVADVEFYPRELFSERYGTRVTVDRDIDIHNMRIVDFARMDNNGLTLRNVILTDYIIKHNVKQIPDILIGMLIHISKYVTEKGNDTWYIIFQCLLKEDILTNKFMLDKKSIKRVFLSIKEYYKNISYYWLQLGMFEQELGDYAGAYNHFEISASIRPKSYKIEHAIARNFMRYANNTNDKLQAMQLFEEGERRMKELINSKQYYKEKAKPFSVNCYVIEKVKFIKRFDIIPSNKELEYIISILDSIKSIDDPYYENVIYKFYKLLEKINRVSILRLDPRSPYMNFIGKHQYEDTSLDDIDPVMDM